MNFNNTKTVHQLLTEVQRNALMPYKPADNTTLNEVLGIALEAQLPTGKFPDMRYICLGTGGTVNATVGGRGIQRDRLHAATDPSLFEHIPMAVREVGNDFSPAERDRYRLRKELTRDGVNYIAYYAFVGTYETEEAQVNVITTEQGVSTSTPFDYTTLSLIAKGSNGIITNKVMSVGVNASVTLDRAAFAELTNAISIFYSGDMDLGVINEIATVQGVESEITSSIDNVLYKEILGASCCNFSTAKTDVSKISPDGFSINMFIGNTLALME